MGRKRVTIGDIENDILIGLTPVQWFEKALNLYDTDFDVECNNALFLEALEVLCGEENLEVYLKVDELIAKVDVIIAYNYLGDFYDVIDYLRTHVILLNEEVDMDKIKQEIKNFNEKYLKIVNGYIEEEE